MEFVSVTRDAGLLTIAIDRPQGHNSLNRALRLELRKAFEEAAEQCVVKPETGPTGSGDATADPGPVRALLLKVVQLLKKFLITKNTSTRNLYGSSVVTVGHTISALAVLTTYLLPVKM